MKFKISKELNIENFVINFLTLTNKLSCMAEEEKMFYFREVIKDNTKRCKKKDKCK